MSATYVVTSPLVLAKNEEGGDVYLYEGATVPDGQSQDWLDRHLESKQIATKKAAEKAAATPEPDPDAEPKKAPAKSS